MRENIEETIAKIIIIAIIVWALLDGLVANNRIYTGRDLLLDEYYSQEPCTPDYLGGCW